MQRCEFCGTLCEDGTRICASCGGNSFLQVCSRCGTEFKNAAVCPKCALPAGQKARVCPRCGTEYFGVCPHCGDLSAPPRAVDAVYAPPKKRHTVLWVLGWIFFFPIPLTVLIARSKKMKPWLKAVLIAALWGFLLLYSASDSEETQTVSDPPPITEMK